MGLLGFDVPKTEIDALFDAFDPDGSGAMEFKELQRCSGTRRPPPTRRRSSARGGVGRGGRAREGQE